MEGESWAKRFRGGCRASWSQFDPSQAQVTSGNWGPEDDLAHVGFHADGIVYPRVMGPGEAATSWFIPGPVSLK